MKILFAIFAVVLFLGMVGDKEKDNRRNYTYGFIATIAGIVALYMIN